ncbi:Protein of unknown function DUF761 [Theobroma cacao]|nr:Protein of unknown function DUF761 [Theobroma cacao]
MQNVRMELHQLLALTGPLDHTFFFFQLLPNADIKRNDEIEKENNNNQSKFDNVQSFVSRFLQVSSVFDDEAENLPGSDESKVQTWSNQYYRNEPPVVVAKEHAVLDEQRSSSSRISEKPLLLPVRSLKSRVLDANNLETSRENSSNSSSLSRSDSSFSSKRFSNKGTNGALGGLDQDALEKKLNENNVVLPSPIPWRSRSGRMEVKDDIESEFNRLESRSFRSQTNRLSRSSSLSSSPKLSPSPPLSSPKKLSPSPPLSMEAQAKSAEDVVRKKSIYRSPPPPPPPPPPPIIHKSSSLKPSSTLIDDEVSFDKDLPWNYASEDSDGDTLMGTQRDYVDGLSKGKSLKMIRPSDSLRGTRKDGEIENGINGKTVRFDQTSFRTEKLNRESVSFMPKPTFMEFPQEQKHEFVEKLVMETTDDESESENEEVGDTSFLSSFERSPNIEEASPSSGIDGGSDVDKKADEFIAKVREQIRLQRIDSIKRSSGQMKRNSPSFTEGLFENKVMAYIDSLGFLSCNQQLHWRIVSVLKLVGYCISCIVVIELEK